MDLIPRKNNNRFSSPRDHSMQSFSDAEFFLQVLDGRDITNLHQLEGWAPIWLGPLSPRFCAEPLVLRDLGVLARVLRNREAVDTIALKAIWNRSPCAVPPPAWLRRKCLDARGATCNELSRLRWSPPIDQPAYSHRRFLV
jgi:hypothetical protein